MATTQTSRTARRRRQAARATLVAALLAGAAGVLHGTTGSSGVIEHEGLAPRPAFELQPAVEATFRAQSYRPGSWARLELWRSERSLTMQVFRIGPNHTTPDHATLRGEAVSGVRRLGVTKAHRPFPVRIGRWPSGHYFARLEAPDGRVGFAPFVVRPRRLGESRVLVVLPTFTWQAYNFRDDNGDGRGDTWYAGWKQDWAPRVRPFLARGVPPRYNTYDLHFQHWLDRTGRRVDTFSDEDLNGVASAEALRRAYDVIVFPGHHEYVTTREYDVVERFRDLGGNLMFLSSNNFFWRTHLRGPNMVRDVQWRDLGRPEAALVGVQFIGTDGGRDRAPWIVRGTSHARWLFSGTGAGHGERFSRAGIEIDHTAASSPRGIRVVAEIPALFRGQKRFTAQMTYYRARSGAEVFAAGAMSVGGFARQPAVARLLTNLFDRMSPMSTPVGLRQASLHADARMAPRIW